MHSHLSVSSLPFITFLLSFISLLFPFFPLFSPLPPEPWPQQKGLQAHKNEEVWPRKEVRQNYLYMMGSLETRSMFTSVQAMCSAGLSAPGCLPCVCRHRRYAGSLHNCMHPRTYYLFYLLNSGADCR